MRVLTWATAAAFLLCGLLNVFLLATGHPLVHTFASDVGLVITQFGFAVYIVADMALSRKGD